MSLYLGLFLYSNDYFLIEAKFVKKSTHLEISRKLDVINKMCRVLLP